jgi:ABC-2 type transport system permease protein
MKLARDTWLIFQYEVALLVRNPVNVAITLIQPITYLLLFTPFLKGLMHVNSYSGAFQIYVPSLFAAMGVFSGMFAGFSLLAAMRQGVITRCRVTPLSRVSLLMGRVLMYVLLDGFQAVVIVAVATVFGLRADVGDELFALVLLSVMVTMSVSFGFDLALLVPNENSLMTVTNSASQALSLAWGTNSMRAVFQGHLESRVVWQACLIMGVVGLATVVLSSRLFSREVA